MAEAVVLQHVCELFFEIGLPYNFFELHWGKDKGVRNSREDGKAFFLSTEIQSFQENISYSSLSVVGDQK